MESTKFESMPIVEEVSVTERIGSFVEAGAEIGIAKIGLSACTKHCPSENPKIDHYHSNLRCQNSRRNRMKRRHTWFE